MITNSIFLSKSLICDISTTIVMSTGVYYVQVSSITTRKVPIYIEIYIEINGIDTPGDNISIRTVNRVC